MGLLWLVARNILKMAEGIKEFWIFSHLMGLFDAKFYLFLNLSQNFDLLMSHKTAKNQKISNLGCHFQDFTHICSLAH